MRGQKERLRLGGIFSLFLVSVLAYSTGIRWGLPEFWHPDEGMILKDSVRLIKEKKLCPLTYFYGAVPKYALGLFLSPQLILEKSKGDNSITGSAEDRWLGRLFFSLFLALTVVMFFKVLIKLTSFSSAFFSSLILALSPGFVCIGHFIKPHIFLAFFTMLILFLGIDFIFKGKRIYLYSAAFVSGLSTGVLMNGIFNLAFLFILMTGYWRKNPGEGRSSLGVYELVRLLIFVLALFLAGFFILYPCALRHPFAFIYYQYLALFWNQGGRGILAPVGFLRQPESLFWMSGGMGLALCLIGMVIYFWKMRHGASEELRMVINWLILPAIIVFYLSLSRSRMLAFRYLLPYLPLYYIFLAFLLDYLNKARLKKLKFFIIGASLIWLIYLAVLIDRSFLNDTREQARQWIYENIPKGSKIELTIHLPRLDGVYRINYLSWVYEKPGIPCWLVSLQNRIRKMLGYSENGIGCEEEKYREQWQKKLKKYLYEYSEDGLRERNPDYIVASSIFYERYLNYPNLYPKVKSYWEELLAGRLGYQVIKTIAPPRVVQLTTEFVSPEILILKRKEQDRK